MSSTPKVIAMTVGGIATALIGAGGLGIEFQRVSLSRQAAGMAISHLRQNCFMKEEHIALSEPVDGFLLGPIVRQLLNKESVHATANAKHGENYGEVVATYLGFFGIQEQIKDHIDCLRPLLPTSDNNPNLNHG